MKTLAGRRISFTTILLGVGIGCYFLWNAVGVALRPQGIYSGIALLVLMLALTLFNARKKLPFLPLIKASHWTQFHIYTGFLSVFLFLLHTGGSWPSGGLETGLFVLFWIVSISGVAGLVITRWLPGVMARSGESLTFENIPKFETRLRREVEEMVCQGEEEFGASAIGELYINKLSDYFKPRFGPTLFMGRIGRFRVRAFQECDKVARYLDDDGLSILNALRKKIDLKYNLDVQKAAQWMLRFWLFIHIPVTYGLIITSLVHAWIALAFTSSR
ncbi:hypothetical protein [Haloferula sp.]|uniref:hypothetical protein n=1 Tax=Haloferula sp. TaxID=2497595 RepID=UPI0032A03729